MGRQKRRERFMIYIMRVIADMLSDLVAWCILATDKAVRSVFAGII